MGKYGVDIMKMQDWTDSIKTLIENIPIPVRAACVSLVLCVLRLAYDEDKRRWRRKALEAAICFWATFAAGSGLKAVGIPLEGAYLIGAVIGWMGADFVREHAANAIAKKMDK